jgi:DNA primase
MKQMFNKYSKVIVMFDNDEAGIKGMKRYKELYPQVEIILLTMSKDISDSVKDYSAAEVRNRIVPLLNKKIN